MSVWFVIPAVNETAFRAAYLAERVRGHNSNGSDEKVGVMQSNADGTKLFCGSRRMSATARLAFAARAPAWLQIHSSWPPPGGWDYPVRDV